MAVRLRLLLEEDGNVLGAVRTGTGVQLREGVQRPDEIGALVEDLTRIILHGAVLRGAQRQLHQVLLSLGLIGVVVLGTGQVPINVALVLARTAEGRFGVGRIVHRGAPGDQLSVDDAVQFDLGVVLSSNCAEQVTLLF